MSAYLDPETMRGVDQAVRGFLARHSQSYVGAAVGLDQGNVSRRTTRALDGEAPHAQIWNAGQLAAMIRCDHEVLGELAAIGAPPHLDPLGTVAELLAAAQVATQSVQRSSPSGAWITHEERTELRSHYARTIGILAQAMAWMERHPS